ncbi:membrane protein [Prevotella dentasini JCM 15908]
MATTTQAGGLLTNTNQHIAFNRSFARIGAIGIDGVYFNPAGVAFMDKGFHVSLNIQNVYQTREMNSSVTVPSLQGTPFYQPFKLNGGNEEGYKYYKGKASVPILPSFQAALNYDKWGFQLGFGLTGGGGKATFNDGLPSFERQIAMIPALLYAQGLGSTTPSYSLSSYMNGQQYDFGLQIGATYKFSDHLAAYAGARFNYIYNKYEGNIVNVSANIGGTNQNLYNYFDAQATALTQKAAAFLAQANAATDPAIKAQLTGAAQQYQAGADKMNQTKAQFADRYLDCTQRGWGITPIIGIDYKTGKWNFGARYEFTTKFNIENDTRRDDTGQFKDGVNTPNDLPGILAVGAQYEPAKNVRILASYHYYFDKDARMDKNKQRHLSGNTREYLAGAEWDVTPTITVSAGGQCTKYGLGNGQYLSDLSFATSSYSLGFGAKIRVAKNAHVNIAYFFTDYEHFNKEYDGTIAAGAQPVEVHNVDNFTRTNKVLGVGLDLDF